MNYLSVLIDPDISLSQRRLLFGHIFFVEDRFVWNFHVIV